MISLSDVYDVSVAPASADCIPTEDVQFYNLRTPVAPTLKRGAGLEEEDSLLGADVFRARWWPGEAPLE